MPLTQQQLERLRALPGHQITLSTLERIGIRTEQLAGALVDQQVIPSDYPTELALVVALPQMQVALLMAIIERQTNELRRMQEASLGLLEAVQALSAQLARLEAALPGPRAVRTAVSAT